MASGTDGIKPLLKVCNEKDAGIFVLVKTSNPSSGELQDRELADSDTIYRAMGKMCESWGEELPGKYGYSRRWRCGGRYLSRPAGRTAQGHASHLLPGARLRCTGAVLPTTFAPAFDKRGLGAIVNSSRALCALGRRKAATSTSTLPLPAGEAIRMRDAIREAIVAA